MTGAAVRFILGEDQDAPQIEPRQQREQLDRPLAAAIAKLAGRPNPDFTATDVSTQEESRCRWMAVVLMM